jgi:hypothetical protein
LHKSIAFTLAPGCPSPGEQQKLNNSKEISSYGKCFVVQANVYGTPIRGEKIFEMMCLADPGAPPNWPIGAPAVTGRGGIIAGLVV